MEQITKNEMSKLPYIVAVDFDGTLVKDAFPEIGEPNTVLIGQLKTWKKNNPNDRLILWTCRDNDTKERNLDAAVNYLSYYHGLEFDSVNKNCAEVIAMFNNDTRKVYANEYIDDKFSAFEVPLSWVEEQNGQRECDNQLSIEIPAQSASM